MPDERTLFGRVEPLRQRLIGRIIGGDVGSVFRGMAVLATGSAMAKLVGIAAIPILTRLYAPADFGLMAVFNALVLMITPVLTLRYVLAVPLPRRDGTAMNLMALSLLLVIGLGVAMGLVLWAFGEPLLRLVSMEEMAVWWWLIVLGCVGGALYEQLSFWAVRRRDYRVIARTSVTQQLSGNAVMLALGALSVGAVGLLAGQVVNKSGGSLALLRAFRNDLRQSWKQVRFSRIRQLAGRYVSFPVYRVPSQFLLVFAQQSPMIGMAYLYGAQVAGSFSLAMMMLALPLNTLGATMGKALFAEAAHLKKTGQTKVYFLTIRIVCTLFLASLVPAAILFLFGRQLFMLAFGVQWEQAGAFASSLSVYLIFAFVSAPINQLLNLFTSQAFFLVINLARIFFLIGVFGMANLLQLPENDFVLMYSISMALYFILSSVLVMRAIRGESN